MTRSFLPLTWLDSILFLIDLFSFLPFLSYAAICAAPSRFHLFYSLACKSSALQQHLLSINTMAQKKENVWDYPRPPAIELTSKHLRVLYKDIVIADTTNAYRILETSHPPTYYIPIEDVNQDVLLQNSRNTYCEWKGTAHYYDVKIGDEIIRSRVWYYPNPNDKYADIKDHLSFYASPFDCYVNDEKVEAQPGDFYGGWMTSDIEGKVKGGPETWGW